MGSEDGIADSRLEDGGWRMADGERRTRNAERGPRKMGMLNAEDGGRKAEGGRWKVEGGRWKAGALKTHVQANGIRFPIGFKPLGSISVSKQHDLQMKAFKGFSRQGRKKATSKDPNHPAACSHRSQDTRLQSKADRENAPRKINRNI